MSARGIMRYRIRYDNTPKDRASYTLSFGASGKGFDDAQARRDKYFADNPNAPYASAPPHVTKYGVIGTGGGLGVFSTLADIVTAFTRKRAPQQIVFTAGRDETSRVKLYQHIVKRVETMSSTYRGKEVLSRRYNYNRTFVLTRRKRPAPWPERDVPGSYVVVPDTDTETPPARSARPTISRQPLPPGQERVTGHEWIPNRTYQQTVPTGPPSAPSPFMPRVPRTGDKS